MQTATPETHEALSDYTTMDKGEKTIHAIREERQRMKDMIDIVTMTREKEKRPLQKNPERPLFR